jgi:hypothetical protein
MEPTAVIKSSIYVLEKIRNRDRRPLRINPDLDVSQLGLDEHAHDLALALGKRWCAAQTLNQDNAGKTDNSQTIHSRLLSLVL